MFIQMYTNVSRLRIDCQICHSFKDAPAPSAKAASTISFQTDSESVGAALAFMGPWISSGCNTGYAAQGTAC